MCLTKKKMRALLARRQRLEMHRRDLDRELYELDPRGHYQACPLGGLLTGISGVPCWCGASEEINQMPQKEED